MKMQKSLQFCNYVVLASHMNESPETDTQLHTMLLYSYFVALQRILFEINDHHCLTVAEKYKVSHSKIIKICIQCLFRRSLRHHYKEGNLEEESTQLTWKFTCAYLSTKTGSLKDISMT